MHVEKEADPHITGKH